MLRIACVDNVKEITDLMTNYLMRFGEEKDVELDAAAFQGGWAFLEAKQPFDIVFFDVDMPDLDGMSTAKELRKYDDRCIIIFLTNWAQYAINGYEVGALDFLVKPLSYSTFCLRFQRAVDAAHRNRQEDIVVTEKYGKRRIGIRDILFVETERHKLIYHTVSGPVETWEAMKPVAERLVPYGFALCNSGVLVNLRCVEKVEKNSIWVAKKELPVSRSKKKSFLDALTSYNG